MDRVVTGGTELVVTGGDDGFVRVWDVGSDGQGDDAKDPIKEWEVGYPVTSVCWSADAGQVLVGGLDNCIHVRVVHLSLPSDVTHPVIGLRLTNS